MNKHDEPTNFNSLHLIKTGALGIYLKFTNFDLKMIVKSVLDFFVLQEFSSLT